MADDLRPPPFFRRADEVLIGYWPFENGGSVQIITTGGVPLDEALDMVEFIVRTHRDLAAKKGNAPNGR